MAKSYAPVIQTTATLVWVGQNPSGDDLILSAIGSGADFHLGGPDVDTGAHSGFHLANNADAYEIHVPCGTKLYAAAGSANSPLYVTWMNSPV